MDPIVENSTCEKLVLHFEKRHNNVKWSAGVQPPGFSMRCANSLDHRVTTGGGISYVSGLFCILWKKSKSQSIINYALKLNQVPFHGLAARSIWQCETVCCPSIDLIFLGGRSELLCLHSVLLTSGASLTGCKILKFCRVGSRTAASHLFDFQTNRWQTPWSHKWWSMVT